MGKWILGILGTVIAGLLLAWATNILGPSRDNRDHVSSAVQPPQDPSNDDKKDDGDSGAKDSTIAVMRPLEVGINRQGNDFDAFGKPAGNEQLCAELCKNDQKCDSMTYVKSTHLCWLKAGVPPASADADMVSAVKDRHPEAAM